MMTETSKWLNLIPGVQESGSFEEHVNCTFCRYINVTSTCVTKHRTGKEGKNYRVHLGDMFPSLPMWAGADKYLRLLPIVTFQLKTKARCQWGFFLSRGKVLFSFGQTVRSLHARLSACFDRCVSVYVSLCVTVLIFVCCGRPRQSQETSHMVSSLVPGPV